MGKQEQGSQYQLNFAQIQLALKGGSASAGMRQSEEWVPSRQEITGLIQSITQSPVCHWGCMPIIQVLRRSSQREEFKVILSYVVSTSSPEPQILYQKGKKKKKRQIQIYEISGLASSERHLPFFP